MAVKNSELVSDIVRSIAQDAALLRDDHVVGFKSRISWVCIFCQSAEEFDELRVSISKLGKLAKVTETGPVFVIPGVETSAGIVRVIKLRKPDPSRTERGDADFAITDFDAFCKEYLQKPGFKLIERPEFEMIELMDEKRNTRVYFSNPPVEQHDGIKQALADRTNQES